MKNTGVFAFILFMLILFACSNKNKLPKGILPQPQMQSIMWDMIVAGEFLNGYVFPRDSSVKPIAESQGWQKKILDLHKTTKEQFERSYAYYKKHPEVMKVLLDSLSKKQYKADTAKPIKADSNTTPRPDSLKKKMILRPIAVE
jgi:hypothetical protein